MAIAKISGNEAGASKQDAPLIHGICESLLATGSNTAANQRRIQDTIPVFPEETYIWTVNYDYRKILASSVHAAMDHMHV